jgi:hypothetical protein
MCQRLKGDKAIGLKSFGHIAKKSKRRTEVEYFLLFGENF